MFVIEGGRSRADVAALRAVADAVQLDGAQVTLVRHGLGRLSARTVRKAIRQVQPQMIVTTGATSTRDAERLARRLKVPLVCYYWPAGPIEDIHRRPRHGSASPRPRRRGIATHAVVGSVNQEQALRGTATQVSILPPLLDEALFASNAPAAALRSPLRIGVYGGPGSELPALAHGDYVHLEDTTAAKTALDGCTGVLVLCHDAVDQKEAPRRCAAALVCGKAVLACGLEDAEREAVPAWAGSTAAEFVQVLPAAELATKLQRWADALAPLSEKSVLEVRAALAPKQVLKRHAELLLQIAQAGRSREADASSGTGRTSGGALGKLLARLRRMLGR